MLDVIDKHRDELEALCRKYGVSHMELFGSAARNDFDHDSSDLDFVVDFVDLRLENAADRYLGLLVDLEDLFRRSVDLVLYSSIKNPFFKQVVDRTRVKLYAA